MAADSVSRAAVKRRVRDILEGLNLAEVSISYGPPRTPAVGSAVSLGDIRGEWTQPNMRAGRLDVDDRFTLDLILSAWAPGDPDHEQVDADIEELCDEVRRLFADRPFLQDATGNALPGVVHAVPGEVDGPTPWWTNDGVGAAIRLALDVHVRISD